MKPSDYKVSDLETRLCVKGTMDAWGASNRGRVRMPSLNADDAIAHAKALWEEYIKSPEDLPRILAFDPLHTCIYAEHSNYALGIRYRLEPEPESLVLHDILTMLILQTSARNYLS